MFDSRYHDRYDYGNENDSNKELDKFDAFS